MRGRLLLATAVVCALVSIVFAAIAAAEPAPPYDGSMAFGKIEGSDGPEDFEWEVSLSEDEELVQADDRTLLVKYTDRPDLTAMEIRANAAHAADGAAVPTTVTLTGPSTFVYTVHHRAGNAAAGGAPFDYPIIGGEGWEGGYKTFEGQVSYGDPPPVVTPPPTCMVPKITGKTVKGARRRLRRSHCSLGIVFGKRTRSARVVGQKPKPGKSFAAGTEVGVKVAG